MFTKRTAIMTAIVMAASSLASVGTVRADEVTAEASAESTDSGSDSSISEDVYSSLGLNVTTDMPDNAADMAPYDASATGAGTTILHNSGVYVSTNTAEKNCYTVRNKLNRLWDSSNTKSSVTDSYGGLWGAYKFYYSSKKHPNGSSGNSTDSLLSDNTNDVAYTANQNGFSGKYATSVTCDLGSGYDDCVAELRAYGDNTNTTLNGKSYKGGFCVKLFKFSTDGKRVEDISLVPYMNSSQINGDGFKYLNAGYLQENDAAFEIAAADVDHDGVDEIFCYTGAYVDRDGIRYAIVDMWKYSSDKNDWEHSTTELGAGSASLYATDEELKSSAGGKNEKWEWQLLKQSPVVTIAGGNLDRKGGEEIAMTVSAPGSHDKASEAAGCYIYTWSDEKQTLAGLKALNEEIGSSKISLTDKDGGAMASANCAFGTFSIGTVYTADVLIIAGYHVNAQEGTKGTTDISSGNRYTDAAYRFVYYDTSSSQFVVSDYTVKALGKDGQHIVDTAVADAGQTRRYAPTLAPFALACARLWGLCQSVENEQVLFGGDVYEFTLSNNIGLANTSIGSISICSAQRNTNAGNNKDKEQVWIGDVAVGAVSGSDDYKESFLAVVGVHRDEDLRKNDDYYWMDISHFTAELETDEDGNTTVGKYCTGQEGVVAEGNRVNSTYGTWVSLCLPNFEHDGLRVYYQGMIKAYTYPMLLAVLEDAPYFQDLQEAYHYLVLGGTGFESAKSNSSANGWNLDISAGVYTNVEAGTGAHTEFEAEVKCNTSYDYQESSTLGYKVNYESHAGEGNKAVIYTVPMMYYYYKVQQSGEEEWKDLVMSACLEPVTAIVSQETWDEAAAGINKNKKDDETKLPMISDILFNRSGDPSTYVSGSVKGERAFASQQTTSVTNAQGATITQAIETETETEEAYTDSVSIGMRVGLGGKILGNEVMFGVTAEVGGGISSVTSKASGSSFEGAVDNLPEEAEGYGFDWKLVVNKYKGDTGEVWIVGYEVPSATVQRPLARVVSGLTATKATDHSLTLSWDDVLAGTDYNYAIAMLDANGRLSDWDVVSAESGETTYTWGTEDDPLEAGHVYTFVIVPVSGEDRASAKVAGARSAALSVTTLPKGCTMDVAGANIADPQDEDDLTVNIARRPEGTSLVLTASACYAQIRAGADGTEAVVYREPNLIWYSKGAQETEWRRIGTGTTVSAAGADGAVTYTSALQVDDVSADDDNTQWRCTVSYNDISIMSRSVTLDVTHTVSPGGVNVRAGMNDGVARLEAGDSSGFSFVSSENEALVESGASDTEHYTVIFETNGGSEIDYQIVTGGQSAQKPSDPARDGYTFVGWYADEALETAFDFSAPVTEDTTVYAKWAEALTEDSDKKDTDDSETDSDKSAASANSGVSGTNADDSGDKTAAGDSQSSKSANTSTNKTAAASGTPQTGDDSLIILWLLVAITSLGAGFLFYLKKERKNET